MNPSRTTLDQTRPTLPVRLFNRCGALLDKTGMTRSSIKAVDLIETAKRRCGLDDFGGGDFFEGLSRLLDSAQRDAQLNFIGRIVLRADLVRILGTRLFIQRDRLAYPTIGEQEIREPLFIIGLPRSGTTLLHSLLALDPQHRVPLIWEVMSPSPPTRADEKRRIRRARWSCDCFNWLAPTFRHAHPVGAELPQECVSLMAPTFMSDQFDAMYYVPSYRAWFFGQDLQPAYEYHRQFLQHLQVRQAARRWVLKAPTHMFALPTLLDVYPDAIFVQTHRAPLDAMVSVSSLITILRRVFSDAVDPFTVCQDAIDYWSTVLDKFLQGRDRLAANRICDVNYAEIRRDPLIAVRRIYAHFGWTLSHGVEQRMRYALANELQQRNGLHRYDLSQFGVREEESAAQFAAYCDRFGLTAHGKRTSDGAKEKLRSDSIDKSSSVSKHQHI
jgi:hypothetical protein